MIEAGITKSDLNRVNRRKDTDVNSDVSMTKYSAGTAVKLPHQMRLAYRFEYAKHDHRNRNGEICQTPKPKPAGFLLAGQFTKPSIFVAVFRMPAQALTKKLPFGRWLKMAKDG